MNQPTDSKDTSITVAVSGSGGAGAMTAGNLLLDAVGAAGLYGLMTRTAGPQIRGGEAAAILRLGCHPIESMSDRCDALFAMDWRNIDRFFSEIPLGPGSLLICDADSGEPPAALIASGAEILALPVSTSLEAVPNGRPNMFAFGVLGRLLAIPTDVLERVVSAALGSRGPETVKSSLAAASAGWRAIGDKRLPSLRSAEASSTDRWIISGNEATGLGAVKGGIRFVAAYPITPATEVLEWMAPALTKVGGTLVQAEDELASINMVIGASFGGIPALTATSGPGLALMTESIGLATASETPLVVVDVMRGGPSTGIPTKSEQSDLNIAVHGLHGDAPHIVVAPGSVTDCLFTAQWAVHLAESMQVPVVLLSDQFLGQSRSIVDRPADIAFIARRETATEIPETGYRRYAVTGTGVSPMALPGTLGGQYTADGLTHSERGIPSTRAEDHLAQLDKRLRKIEGFDYGNHWADIEGEGAVAIVTWGSVSGAAREAVAALRSRGRHVRLIAIRLLAPFRTADFQAALRGVDRVLVVEQTHSAQFYRYLRSQTELPANTQAFHRPGPLPLRPSEIAAQLETGG